MKICVKDLSGLGSSHDPLIVSYAVTGGCLFVYLFIFFILINLFVLSKFA